MITARLVGDDRVLAWLNATPDIVASELARATTKFCIDRQRRIEEGDAAGRILPGRSHYVKTDLRRRVNSFRSSKSGDAFDARGYRQRTDVPEPSFMFSALKEMEPEIRDAVDEALREALTR